MPRSATIGRKDPAVRSRNGRSYRRLAAWARCHNYRRVNRHVIQQWVQAGLLPKVIRTKSSWGRDGLGQAVDCGRQLLRLCHYRYGEGYGRLDVIAASLWLDGFTVPIDRVRRGLRWGVEQMTIESRRRVAAVGPDARDATAYALAKDPMGLAALPNLSFSDRQALIEEGASSLLDGSPVSRWAQEKLALATGVAPSQIPKLLVDMFGEIGASETDKAIDAREGDLIEVRRFWTEHPEIHEGLDKIRRNRTRAIRRFGAFVALATFLFRIAGPP